MLLLILLFAVSIPVLWLTLFIRGHQLFYMFRDRYPEEAREKIRYAFEYWRHPSKFTYFMTADAAAFLEEKNDAELIAARQAVVRLSIASVAVPFGGMAILIGLIALGVIK